MMKYIFYNTIQLSILIFCCFISNVIYAQIDFNVKAAKLTEKAAWQHAAKDIKKIKEPKIPNRLYDIPPSNNETFNKNLNTAIKNCHKNGGGRVIVPSGEYLSNGPIHLLSGVELHLEEGAIIRFGVDPKDYTPLVKVRWEGTVCYNYSPLIYAYQQKDIAVTGKGEIDGQTQLFWTNWKRGNGGKNQEKDKKILRQMGNDLVPEEQRVFGNGFLDLDNDGKDDGYGDGKNHYLRPTTIEFYECENILIEGITIKNSPFWTIHPVFSKNVTIRKLNIKAGTTNDDGIDPDSCEGVLIEDCNINTHDDAISIKAGRDQDAWNRKGTSNVFIRNCQLQSGVNAVCIGSEMSGGVENVFVENCQISDGKHALNFKCNLDRGGEVKNIFIKDISIEQCDEAMFIFRMDYHGYRGNNFPTKFNNFYVGNLKCRQVKETAFKIVGVAEAPIEKIFLHHISIEKSNKVAILEHTKDILLEEVSVNGQRLKNL